MPKPYVSAAVGGLGLLLAALPTWAGGTANTNYGGEALLDNTTGYYNSALGVSALSFNTIGDDNTGVGFDAGSGETEDSENTAAGSEALNYSGGSGEPGDENTADGFQALGNCPAAEFETAVGAFTLDADQLGQSNTAVGYGALYANTSFYNTAIGYEALFSNIGGGGNTATGAMALEKNTNGNSNTATGFFTLLENAGGSNNTATGYSALLHNTADNNTADGAAALMANTTGTDLTATGAGALTANTIGNNNTAHGQAALLNNIGGSDNTAIGWSSLNHLRGSSTSGGTPTGNQNTAFGDEALAFDGVGGANTGAGFFALSNVLGNANIALGANAGLSLTASDNNIDIGNTGVSGDSGAIRIGGTSSTAAFIAGIYGNKLTSGVHVVVNSKGQLGFGTAISSARFKRDIEDMGAASDGLMKLRPVTFRYKRDPANTLQYGLVAEEVKRVYPELVTYDADGRPEAVLYEELTAMLLNELQKQDAELRTAAGDYRRRAQRLKVLAAQVAADRRELDLTRLRLARVKPVMRSGGRNQPVTALIGGER
jgi:trimeric autotransporter adhesin